MNNYYSLLVHDILKEKQTKLPEPFVYFYSTIATLIIDHVANEARTEFTDLYY